MTILEEIDERKKRAEEWSYATTGGVLGWVQYYGEVQDSDHEQLRKDFCYLRSLIEEMKAKAFDLENRCEAAGVSVE